jgi:hypothetical protein
MATYNFPAWQAPLVESGAKSCTARNTVKRPGRHSVPGERMRLWSGMRTKAARLLGEPLCEAVEPVRFPGASACRGAAAAELRVRGVEPVSSFALRPRQAGVRVAALLHFADRVEEPGARRRRPATRA